MEQYLLPTLILINLSTDEAKESLIFGILY